MIYQYQHLWLGQQRGVLTPQVKQDRITLCWFSQAVRWAVLGGDNAQLEPCSSCYRGSPVQAGGDDDGRHGGLLQHCLKLKKYKLYQI